ncbi:MAG: diguanylate cyclase [Eubacteriaceae bacterium]|nr:diguanylate cyclase [Eubacteriaceae bacterium]
MEVAYYLETNIICIAILLVLKYQMKAKFGYKSREIKLFGYMILSTVLFCIFDIIAGVTNGREFEGAGTILQISNMLYVEMLVLIAWCWTMYVLEKLRLTFSRRLSFVLALPLMLFTVAAVSNPITHFLFMIDHNNIYHRDYGIYMHWIVGGFYLLLPMAAVIYKVVHERSAAKRREMTPFMSFVIAPLIASVLQMKFYGMTIIQAGVTISILMVFIAVQNGKVGQVLTDVLTGLNNRRGLEGFLEFHVQRPVELTVIMMDLDFFKKVNDEYGHSMGDRALVYAAEALKKACGSMSGRPYLCRYGGAEFIIAGVDQSRAEIDDLKNAVNREVDRISHDSNEPFTLSLSIGVASKICMDMNDAEALIKLADEEMYKDKKRFETPADK